MEKKTRILLVDDHRLFRDGLKFIIAEDPEMVVVGEAPNVKDALHCLANLKPDVILLDMEIPGGSGIDVARAATREAPQARIIVLTSHPAPEWIREAVEVGISGAVLKSEAGCEVVRAIRLAMAGRAYFSGEVAAAMVRSYSDFIARSADCRKRDLSEGELEVLKRIADGQSTKEIASALQLSAKTIEARRASLMSKIEVQSVAELTKYAIRTGLSSL